MEIETLIQKEVDLSLITTWRIGGMAKFFIEVKNKEELSAAIAWTKSNNHRMAILGGGSNILVSDLGFDGLVIKIANNDVVVQGERLDVGAGALLGRTVHLATASSLSGLEWGIGIPGTIGGAIRGNAGAYGSSISDCLETVEVYSIKTDKFYKLSHRDCEFGYRESLFKNNQDLLIWRTGLKLIAGEAEEIKNKTESYLEKRLQSQPKLPSAGCVFKNLTIEKLQEMNPELADQAQLLGVVKGGKIGAGWIIDRLDIKGKAIGDAKVSLEHANFIVNTRKASAAQVVTLISFIKQQVRDKYKIQLEEEIQYFGF